MAYLYYTSGPDGMTAGISCSCHIRQLCHLQSHVCMKKAMYEHVSSVPQARSI